MSCSAENSSASPRLSSDLGARLTSALFILSISGASIGQSLIGGEPLFDAARSGDLETVRRHLDRGASPDERDSLDAPLILRAACHGRIEVIRLLVERGADVNARQGGDWTAIFCAARYGELASVKFLIESGADLSLRDEDGDSIADTARQGEAWSVVRLLEGDTAQLATPEPGELNCAELSRYIVGKTTSAIAAALDETSPIETRASEAAKIFTQIGSFGARGVIGDCAGEDFSAAAVADLDRLSQQPCKELRLTHATGVLASAAGQLAFERALRDGDEEQSAAFASLGTAAKSVGAIEEVIAERGCRAASSDEITLLMEAQLGSDDAENSDLEQLWDAIDQGETAASGIADEETVTNLDRFKLWNDCKPTNLVVEGLGDDAKEISLAVGDIEVSARSRLRAARIYTASETANSYLYIRVNVGSSVFSIDQDYKKQTQDLASGWSNYATTWESGSFGSHGGDASYILSRLSRHVDEFIDEYLRVNEMACLAPGRS